jgi:hypothetical protein
MGEIAYFFFVEPALIIMPSLSRPRGKTSNCCLAGADEANGGAGETWPPTELQVAAALATVVLVADAVYCTTVSFSLPRSDTIYFQHRHKSAALAWQWTLKK